MDYDEVKKLLDDLKQQAKELGKCPKKKIRQNSVLTG